MAMADKLNGLVPAHYPLTETDSPANYEKIKKNIFSKNFLRPNRKPCLTIFHWPKLQQLICANSRRHRTTKLMHLQLIEMSLGFYSNVREVFAQLLASESFRQLPRLLALALAYTADLSSENPYRKYIYITFEKLLLLVVFVFKPHFLLYCRRAPLWQNSSRMSVRLIGLALCRKDKWKCF